MKEKFDFPTTPPVTDREVVRVVWNYADSYESAAGPEYMNITTRGLNKKGQVVVERKKPRESYTLAEMQKFSKQ